MIFIYTCPFATHTTLLNPRFWFHILVSKIQRKEKFILVCKMKVLNLNGYWENICYICICIYIIKYIWLINNFYCTPISKTYNRYKRTRELYSGEIRIKTLAKQNWFVSLFTVPSFAIVSYQCFLMSLA